MNSDEFRFIMSNSNVLKILQYFSTNAGVIHDASEKYGIDITTAHRLSNRLGELGFLKQLGSILSPGANKKSKIYVGVFSRIDVRINLVTGVTEFHTELRDFDDTNVWTGGSLRRDEKTKWKGVNQSEMKE